MAGGERCEGCRFWELDEDDCGELRGLCRRNPPYMADAGAVILALYMSNTAWSRKVSDWDWQEIWEEFHNQRMDVSNAMWPGVRGDSDWCGEYRPRVEVEQ